jgi:hypothetical protein
MTNPGYEATQSAQRVFAAALADERPTLEVVLDANRNAVTRKVRGLSDNDARRQLVSSATTQGRVARGEFRPRAPTDPGVTVSRHRALVILVTRRS